jgi:hypothetical protein
MSQKVGDSLFLVTRDAPGEEYYVQRRFIWGTQKTKSVFGKNKFLALVKPEDDGRSDITEDDVVFFRHGDAQIGLAGAFEDWDVANGVRNYLNDR